MAWDFLKKIVGGKDGHDNAPAPQDPVITAATAGNKAHAPAKPVPAAPLSAQKAAALLRPKVWEEISLKPVSFRA